MKKVPLASFLFVAFTLLLSTSAPITTSPKQSKDVLLAPHSEIQLQTHYRDLAALRGYEESQHIVIEGRVVIEYVVEEEGFVSEAIVQAPLASSHSTPN